MPTEPNQNPDQPTTEPTKVELTPEQQELVNKQIAARLSRQEKQLTETFNSTKTQLEEQMKTLSDQLEALKTPGKKDGGDDTEEAKRLQTKALIDAEVAKRTQTEKKLNEATAEKERLANELKATQKRQAMNDAMQGNNFTNNTFVVKLTDDMVEYDEALKTYVVKENGVVKENASLDPMTLAEFYADFAAKNPGFVSSDARGGAGSTPGSKQQGTVTKRSDFKTLKQKSDWITANGQQAFEDLPA